MWTTSQKGYIRYIHGTLTAHYSTQHTVHMNATCTPATQWVPYALTHHTLCCTAVRFILVILLDKYMYCIYIATYQVLYFILMLYSNNTQQHHTMCYMSDYKLDWRFICKVVGRCQLARDDDVVKVDIFRYCPEFKTNCDDGCHLERVIVLKVIWIGNTSWFPYSLYV